MKVDEDVLMGGGGSILVVGDSQCTLRRSGFNLGLTIANKVNR
jgi:hypothetical protein